MNITVNVDEVTLATVVDEVAGFNDDGDYVRHQPQTVADLVAARIVERLVKDDQYPHLRDQVIQVREELIRAALAPVIEEALTVPFRKTSTYGEPAGEPVTLRTVIAAEAQRMLTHYESDYGQRKLTVMQALVRKEVEAALAKEIRDAVAQAREQVSGEIGQMVASAVAAGMRSR